MMDLNHIKISANSFNQVNIKKKKKLVTAFFGDI